MKVKKYTCISIIILAIAIAFLILVLTGDLKIALLSLYALIFIVPVGLIVSIVSLFKERTKLSVIMFLSFILIIPVGFYVVPAIEMYIHDYTRKKKYEMTDNELFDAYEKISGKRALCVLAGGSEPKFLLDVMRIDCDSIGDGDILLQYECAEIKASYAQLKGWSKETVYDSRDIVVIHYIHCVDEEVDYKVRYYYRYNYRYNCKRGISKFFYKTDDIDNDWVDYGYIGSRVSSFGRLLSYYDEHQSKIPVIATDEVTNNRTHVRFREYEDRYMLIFNRFGNYDDFTVISAYLQERYGATIFDISTDNFCWWSASIKIGDSVMKLHSELNNESRLVGSLSDIPIMEEIATYFEVYLAEK